MAGNQHPSLATRDFSHITDMTSLILSRIEFPLRRRRNIICALQGKAGGRARFECSHWALARRLEHTGAQLAAEMAAYREVKALKSFQERTGYVLFNVIAADGEIRRRTTYEDRITPVAARAVERARRSEAWRNNPAKALEQQADAAVAELERRMPSAAPPVIAAVRADVGVSGGGTAKRVEAANLLARRRRDALTRAVGCCELVASTIGAEGIVDFAEKLATDILQRAHFLAQHLPGGEAGAHSKASGTSPSPPSPPHTRATIVVAGRDGGDGATGLQTCSPTGGIESMRVEPDVLAAALEYARAGWAVFPLHTPDGAGVCSCPKRAGCSSAGKHPRTWSGVRDATTEVGQIVKWWRRWPEANVGLAMGEVSGVVCLDVDPRHGGDASLAELVGRHGELPETALAATGGGGFHIFFRHPGVPLKNLSGALGTGLDVKTDGGLVVAAPSLHASGRRYEWACAAFPAEMPDWLLELLRTHSGATRPPARRAETGGVTRRPQAGGTSVSEGSRNNHLFNVGCAMRGRGETLPEIECELARVNRVSCTPPLPDEEVRKIAASAARYRAGGANKVTGGTRAIV